MMATKLYLPRLRGGIVARPRLLEQLRRGAESRLTLVSAPAGFGKTTLIAEWLRATLGDDRRVAWVSLDQADNEPATFWSYVVSALNTALPGIGAASLELLGSSPIPTELALTTVLNELAAAPEDVWLVLDDYHVVESEDIRDGMAFLLEHLPPTMHVLLSTRADPDLPLSRWRVRGELVEIRAADLRFTSEEAAAYLNEVAGLGLVQTDIAALEQRTEGWIAALQLAALSIQGREDVSGFIARFAGNDRYIVDYLVEEVLAHQSVPAREFLLRTAILDRLTGPLCDAVTGRQDSSQLLITLERANLFLVALDDRREWYRYHHLFADVLRARLLAERPDLVPLLHLRASQWYESHVLTEEAVRHALVARDYDRAVHLIEVASTEIRRHREEGLVHGWLKVLPDESIRRSPILSAFYGHMHIVSGDLAGMAARLDDAERALAAAPVGRAAPTTVTEELRTLPATIAIYRASLAQARGDVAGTTEHAQRALDLTGPDDHLARGGAAGFLGLAAWANGDVSSALDTFSQAVASLHAAGNLVDALSSTGVLADMWIAAGRPSQARRVYQDALLVTEAQGERLARVTVDLHVGISEIDVEAGDLDSAQRHLDIAATFGDLAAASERRFRWFLARGLLAQARGEPDDAIDLLDEAEVHYRPGFFPDLRPIAAIRARVRIRQGRLSHAADWAREHGVSAADEISYLREFDHLTLVRLQLARHRADPDPDAIERAAHLLNRLLGAAETSGRGGSLVEIRLLRALVQDALGDRPQALESLAQAWALAPEPDGYVRLFLNEGAPMVELLRAAEQRADTGGQARRLLAFGTADGGKSAPPGQQSSSAAVSSAAVPSAAVPLSERELQVLRLLATDLTGPEIARQLFVSHNTLRTHTKHIFTKLDVTNRRAAVRRAHELDLI